MRERPRRRRPVAGGPVHAADKQPRTLLGKRYSATRGLGGLGSVGLEIALSIVLPLLLGSWLDKRWGTGPWLAGVGFGLGLATAVRAVARAMTTMRKIAEKEEAEMGNPEPLYPDDETREGEDASQTKASTEGEAPSSDEESDR